MSKVSKNVERLRSISKTANSEGGRLRSVSQSANIGGRPRSLSVRTIDLRHDKTSSEVIEGNISKCQEFMRKFWKPKQPKCQSDEQGLPSTTQPSKRLPSGSSYDGTWEGPWMSGYGGYIFPNGVEYEGEFHDGMFHGQGDLRYPNGVKLIGLWYKGTIVDRTVVFSDNLQYSEKDWLYCQDPDRRYRIEYDDGVQPGGKSYITADQPARELPEDLYDTGDGYFNPGTFVYKDPELTSILRATSEKEQDWIQMNCRTGLDGPVGAVPGLYGEWLPAQLKVRPPPVPAAKVLSDTSLFKCLSVFDDEVNFMVRFLNMGGSSSSSSSSSG